MKFYTIINNNSFYKDIEYPVCSDYVLRKKFKNSFEQIWFSREDILNFLNKGTYIREVSIPKDEKIVQMDKNNSKIWHSKRVIFGEMKKITLSVIKDLVKEGANIAVNNNSPIRWAVINGEFEIAKFLIELGVDIHIMDDILICLASKNGHLEIVKLLIEKGSDVNANNGMPIHEASLNGYLEIVKFLVEHGANVNIFNNGPINCANINNNSEIIEYLIEKGADSSSIVKENYNNQIKKNNIKAFNNKKIKSYEISIDDKKSIDALFSFQDCDKILKAEKLCLEYFNENYCNAKNEFIETKGWNISYDKNILYNEIVFKHLEFNIIEKVRLIIDFNKTPTSIKRYVEKNDSSIKKLTKRDIELIEQLENKNNLNKSYKILKIKRIEKAISYKSNKERIIEIPVKLKKIEEDEIQYSVISINTSRKFANIVDHTVGWDLLSSNMKFSTLDF